MTPTNEELAAIHRELREQLGAMRTFIRVFGSPLDKHSDD